MPDLATAALIRKRAELAGEIDALDAALSQLRADLAHLDAAIRIMSPDTDPEERISKPWKRGCECWKRGWPSWSEQKPVIRSRTSGIGEP